MAYLRSNSSHSIHVDFHSLRNFAREQGINLWNSESFALPYHRPSIELFNKHAQFCIDKYQLKKIHIPQAVTKILPDGEIEVNGEKLRGTVIYAGSQQRPLIPPWAAELNNAVHVFGNNFYRCLDAIPPSPLVIGAGISALQLTIALAKRNKNPCLITRRPLQIFRFDFDTCYIGPGCRPMLDSLEAVKYGRKKRMTQILDRRFSGVVPQEIFDEFQNLRHKQLLDHAIVPSETAVVNRAKSFTTIIFCTGFEQEGPSDHLLQQKGQEFIRGYPVLGKDLRWGPRVFIGGLSTMYRIGPAAPNIIGAHLVWRIIRKKLS